MNRKAIVVAFILACMTVFISLAGAPAPTKTPFPVERVLAKVKSTKKAERLTAMANLLEERKALVRELSEMVHQKNADKYSDESRAVAAYLLGELRAAEGVPALSSALLNPPFSSRRSDWDMKYPYERSGVIFIALVRIGRRAVPQMIENLRTSDNTRGVVKSSATVLYHVLGGKAHVLELLDKLLAREKDEAAKARLVKARELVTAMKEDEPPLY